MAFTNFDLNEYKTYSSLIIFSYPNSTDFTIDITDNITSSTNAIIKLYEKCNIENNIFGYVFYGIQINNYTNGLKLLCGDNKEEKQKEQIISNNTNIELIINNDINIQQNATIQYSMVLKEPEYDIYNLYPIKINTTYCGGEECEDEKEIFSKQQYYGRISYCDIIFNLDILSQDCDDENCLICNKDTDKTCLICKYLYMEENGKKLCLDENKIPPTEITTIPTTFLTIIPSTIITNEIENIQTTNIISTDINNLDDINTSIETTTTKSDEQNKNNENNCTNEEIMENKCSNKKITVN